MTAKITASFVLSPGNQLLTTERKYTHFWIVLNVTDYPPSTYAVTYELHESFPIPIQEIRSRPGKEGFPVKIATYGDFEVRAKVRTLSESYRISRLLSDALRETYFQQPREKLPSGILKAIDEIAKH
jgi:transcription initiation factor IIF auxiliary subunit